MKYKISVPDDDIEQKIQFCVESGRDEVSYQCNEYGARLNLTCDLHKIKFKFFTAYFKTHSTYFFFFFCYHVHEVNIHAKPEFKR